MSASSVGQASLHPMPATILQEKDEAAATHTACLQAHDVKPTSVFVKHIAYGGAGRVSAEAECRDL